MQARTLVELGRWVEAVDRYATIQSAPEDPNNPAFQRASADAAQELAVLMQRLPRVRIVLSGESNEAEVVLDDRVLPRALVGVDAPLDPGAHHVSVRRFAKVLDERDLSVAEGERQEVVIDLAPPPAPPPRPPPPPATFAPPPAPERGPNVPVIASFAAGGAGVVFGAITGVVALGKKSDLDATCHTGCPASSRDTLDAYRLNRTLSYVGFGVGIAGAAAGSYLLFSASDRHGEVAVRMAPAALRVEGRF